MRFFTTLLVVASSLFAFMLDGYKDFHFEKYNQNLYIMHGPVEAPSKKNRGFMNNPAIIIAQDGVIVIDPGGSYNIGKLVVVEIQKVTQKPVLAIFSTHKHGDHWFGAKAIHEAYPKAIFYASKETIESSKAGEADHWYMILDNLTNNLDGTKPFFYPDHTTPQHKSIQISDQKFYLFHTQKAHTNTDIIILHQNSDTLFLGDNVMRGRFGAFDDSSSIFGNLALLQRLIQKEYQLCVPGHGQSGVCHEVSNPI